MKKILFQGDSITDCGRDRNHSEQVGTGYPNLIKAELGFEHPGKFAFYNRGVSGDRVLDVYARIVRDILHIQPDFMSILIGVNDVWHGLDWQNGTGLERYEKVYNVLIDEIKAELPDCRIIILEPFVLRGSATDDREDQPNRFELFYNGVREMANAARRVAEKHALPFVALQNKFDVMAQKADPSYWLADGVHPTAMGHELIKREWIRAFWSLA